MLSGFPIRRGDTFQQSQPTPTKDHRDDDPALPTIKFCHCSARGLRTHQSQWSADQQQRNSLSEGIKSIDGRGSRTGR